MDPAGGSHDPALVDLLASGREDGRRINGRLLWATVVALAAVAAAGAVIQSSRPAKESTTGSVTISVSPDVMALARGEGVDVLGPLQDTVRRAAEALRVPSISLGVVVDASSAVAQIGVGESLDPLGNVTLYVAPTSPLGGRAELTTWLDLAAAHQLDLATRALSGAEGSGTLLESFIDLGLADQFAASIVGRTATPPWDRALTAVEERAAWAAARPLLANVDRAVRLTWLWGGHGRTRWTGFTLGFDIVKAARLRDPHRTWAAVTRETAAGILAASQFQS